MVNIESGVQKKQKHHLVRSHAAVEGEAKHAILSYKSEGYQSYKGLLPLLPCSKTAYAQLRLLLN